MYHNIKKICSNSKHRCFLSFNHVFVTSIVVITSSLYFLAGSDGEYLGGPIQIKLLQNDVPGRSSGAQVCPGIHLHHAPNRWPSGSQGIAKHCGTMLRLGGDWKISTCTLLAIKHGHWKWTIYIWLTYEEWWFAIGMSLPEGINSPGWLQRVQGGRAREKIKRKGWWMV